jgi:hypothetical protein
MYGQQSSTSANILLKNMKFYLTLVWLTTRWTNTEPCATVGSGGIGCQYLTAVSMEPLLFQPTLSTSNSQMLGGQRSPRPSPAYSNRTISTTRQSPSWEPASPWFYVLGDLNCWCFSWLPILNHQSTYSPLTMLLCGVWFVPQARVTLLLWDSKKLFAS